MMDTTFYVVCPSNTPEPGNKISNFTVRLPNTLDLGEGEWSVALSSIIYPVSFQADSQDEMTIGIVYANGKPKKEIHLPNSLSFNSIENLEQTVNETIFGHSIKKTPQKRAVAAAVEDEDEEGEVREKRDGEKEQKMLDAAANEVKIRSNAAKQQLATEIDDKITDIEMMGAKVEHLQFGMEMRMVINENFSKEEADDINQKIRQARDDAIKIRGNAQLKRRDLAIILGQYGQLVGDFEIPLLAKDLPEARKLANQAKAIVKQLEEMNGWVDHDKQGVKILVDFLFEKSAELSQMQKPMDIGMRNTIGRIKETIRERVGKERLAELEIYFFYDQNYGRFFLYNHKPLEIKNVTLSPRLGFMLGFETDKATQEVRHVRIRRDGGFAKYTPDIKAGIHQLYVYMPGIVDSTYLGNIQAPLLRIINVDKPPNSIVESIYSNLHFIKVIEKRISSIKIQIHDSFGEFIKFNWGTVIVTLAFKRNLF